MKWQHITITKGIETKELPYDLASKDLKPVYKSIPGWNEDICSITDYDALPIKVKDYVQFLEDYLEVKVTIAKYRSRKRAVLLFENRYQFNIK